MAIIVLPFAEGLPVVDIEVGPCSADTEGMRAAGIPPRLLFGFEGCWTASRRSHVEGKVAEALRLRRGGDVKLGTLYSGGQFDRRSTCFGSLWILHHGTKTCLGDVEFIISLLPPEAPEAILGADVLERCLFIYNGQARNFTLSF